MAFSPVPRNFHGFRTRRRPGEAPIIDRIGVCFTEPLKEAIDNLAECNLRRRRSHKCLDPTPLPTMCHHGPGIEPLQVYHLEIVMSDTLTLEPFGGSPLLELDPDYGTGGPRSATATSVAPVPERFDTGRVRRNRGHCVSFHAPPRFDPPAAHPSLSRGRPDRRGRRQDAVVPAAPCPVASSSRDGPARSSDDSTTARTDGAPRRRSPSLRRGVHRVAAGGVRRARQYENNSDVLRRRHDQARARAGEPRWLAMETRGVNRLPTAVAPEVLERRSSVRTRVEH